MGDAGTGIGASGFVCELDEDEDDDVALALVVAGCVIDAAGADPAGLLSGTEAACTAAASGPGETGAACATAAGTKASEHAIESSRRRTTRA